MTLLDVILQGIIQGLTEFLPVSSSGHLLLYSFVTGIDTEDTAFLLSAFLHFGTIVAICIAFRSTVTDLCRECIAIAKDMPHGVFFKKGLYNPERRMIVMLLISLVLLVPFYFVRDTIESIASTYMIVLGFFFLYTSAILFLSDRCTKGEKEIADLTPLDAVIVGLFQAVALFPGISRSGSTIASGLFRGMDRETAVKYSFMLGLPTTLAGCLSELKDAVDADLLPVGEIPLYLVGMVVAMGVGILSIRMTQYLVKSNKFVVFSAYTGLLGIGVIIYSFVK